MSGNADDHSIAGEESDDDFDWEEVAVPIAAGDAQPPVIDSTSLGLQEEPSERPHIEITIQTEAGKKKGVSDEKKARAEELYAARLARLTCHQAHTVALLANARIRNKWINDPLLHARLMSLVPLPLQNAFATITKSRVPDAAARGRLFENAITRLVEWWSSSFRIERTGHIKNRTWDEVQKVVTADPGGKGKGKDRDLADLDGFGHEVIKSEKSLMKHALMMRGSRDTSAQLFTALCRALGIPARLVVSLQSVPWQASVGKPKPPTKKKPKQAAAGQGMDAGGKGVSRGKGKVKAVEDEDEDEDEMEEVAIPGSSPLPAAATEKGKCKANETPVKNADGEPSNAAANSRPKAPIIKLRKTRGRKLGTAATEQYRRRERTPDPTTTPPVFWTEVFSRADTRWLPVDPIRSIVNKRKAFDPTPNPHAVVKPDRHKLTRVENRMVYVLAFEEDGHARDVTPRYAREYGAKVAKVQQGGKGRKEWWERILRMVKRPYQLHRDDLEDDELQLNQMTEGMPTTMAGFKDHPIYVLERHLRRDEAIHPPVELGKFRGEPVYPRSSVLPLKTAENWMRQGRKVKEGAQPMKWVKQRAMTANKQRAIEMALAEQQERAGRDQPDDAGSAGEDGAMQGLYAENQTELYKPDPVVNGKVPKNNFGNIDLYVPSMLPEGAVYIPYKGATKIARQLGFDYAEAVTSFEFKKRRAFPVITGIVAAAENEAAILEAYWEVEQENEERRRAKKHEQAIKRWTKLVQGLRIRQRVQAQYADAGEQQPSSLGPAEDMKFQQQGGFLTGADDVVQPYTLPKSFYEVLQASAAVGLADEKTPDNVAVRVDQDRIDSSLGGMMNGGIEDDTEDLDMEEVSLPVPPSGDQAQVEWVPKTMLQLAKAAAQEPDPQSDAAQHSSIPAGPLHSSTNDPNSAATSLPSGRETRQQTGARQGGRRKPRGSHSARKRKRASNTSDISDGGSDDVDAPSTPKRGPPAKRGRRGAAAVPASSRVLRTRTPKSATKIQEEREMEEAYRMAAAE